MVAGCMGYLDLCYLSHQVPCTGYNKSLHWVSAVWRCSLHLLGADFAAGCWGAVADAEEAADFELVADLAEQ